MDVLVVDSEVIRKQETLLNEMAMLVKKSVDRVEELSEEWLTSEEAAKYLKTSVRTLERYQDDIGYSHPFGEKRFLKSKLWEWLMKYYFQVKPSHKRHFN